jgi:hypothetical protein
VQDVVAHLCEDEVYNEACLDGTLEQLDFRGGLDATNNRNVRRRRSMTAPEVLSEWERRQRRVRRAWGQIGIRGFIHTAGAGRYPLRLQVWHLAREYAIHADDIEVPVPARARPARRQWRIAFGLFAAREEGEPIRARLRQEQVELTLNGRSEALSQDAFIGYLTGRPQQLGDPAERRTVRALLRG